MKPKISILTGAGISVASGLKTFRGEGGLWEGYDVMKVASIEGWHENKEKVIEFYNKRKAQYNDVKPNEAHSYCAKLEKMFNVHVITQNIDDLHERAGSNQVLHLHGSILNLRSSGETGYKEDWINPLKVGDKCPSGYQLRPDIVWFGEQVPLLPIAAELVSTSDIVLIVGTSMQVYPAAGLVSYASQNAEIYYVDPQPQINYELSRNRNLTVIPKTAVEGMREIYEKLKRKKGKQ